jgi:arylsulfatase A-like enzyme
VPPKSVLAAPGLTSKTTHLPPTVEDHMVMNLVQSTFQHMRPTVMLVNIPEFDWPLGHVDGAGRDPALVRQLMQHFDADLGRLEDSYRKAGILDQTLFVFTSDHGFAPIYHTVSRDDIEHAVTSAGTSIVSDTFHTAGYIWVNDLSKAAQAAANIAGLQNPYIQSVYFKEHEPDGSYAYIRASGAGLFHVAATEAANQYLLNTFAGPNGPDVAVFFTENSGSEPGGQATWKGDHGGAAWNSQHLRIILSGAGIKPGVTSSDPAPLMDIAPTILSLMGVTPTGMQGVPLTEAMAAPTKPQQSARTAQNATLRPVINALAAESQAEIAAGQ